ncbi:MAG: MATE family efflux transporter [Actinomycetota bacterium]|nr:MATE family efflux transporter [Actinomycetota bacterium]
MSRRERDRRIVALAVPALGTLAVEPLYVLVDTAIVGRLGTVPLAGLAVASAVLTTLLTVCNFLAYGTTARVAFLSGRGDRRGGATVAAQGLWLAVAIGLPLVAAVGLAGRRLAGLVGGEGAVLEAATTYLRISAVGIPLVLVALVGNGYLRGVSDTRTPLLVVAVANVVNLVLEVVLVYGFDLGVAGSAWGTVVAQLVAAVWFLVLVGRRVVGEGVTVSPVREEIVRLLVAGRHLLLRTAALLGTLALATSAAARVGAATLAGHQIALQVHTFLALVLDSLAIPGQILVGTSLGAGQLDEARTVSRRLVRLGIVIGAVIGLALVVTSWALPHAFSGDPTVVDQATVALMLVGLAQVPAAVAFVLDGVLIGSSDFRFLKWNMLAGLVVFLPFALAVLRWHRLGIVGIWTGIVVWMLFRATANGVRFRGQAWTAGASS